MRCATRSVPTPPVVVRASLLLRPSSDSAGAVTCCPQNALRSAEIESMRQELERDRKTLIDEFDVKLSELYSVRAVTTYIAHCTMLSDGDVVVVVLQAYNALGDAQQKLRDERVQFDTTVEAFQTEKVRCAVVLFLFLVVGLSGCCVVALLRCCVVASLLISPFRASRL